MLYVHLVWQTCGEIAPRIQQSRVMETTGLVDLRTVLLEELNAIKKQINQEVDTIRSDLSKISSGQQELRSAIHDLGTDLSAKQEQRPFHTKVSPTPRDAVGTDMGLEHGDRGSVRWSDRTDRPSCSLERTIEKRQTAKKMEILNLLERGGEINFGEAASQHRWKHATLWERFMLMETKKKEFLIDFVFGNVIFLNAVFIWFSTDHWDDELNGYFVISVLFSLLYCSEFAFKLHLHGCCGYLCGEQRRSAIFDLSLLLLDCVQLILFFSAIDVRSLEQKGLPSASMFRLLRILRLVRVLTVLRLSIFEDLLKMIQGILSGARTLLWACILLLVIVYIMALLCRNSIGIKRESGNQAEEYFNSVPRSAITVLRCSFGDCSTTTGESLPEVVIQDFGTGYGYAYAAWCFVLTVGIFNVISAIFVDATMSQAEENRLAKLHDRFADPKLWATRVSTVYRRCLDKCGFDVDAKGGVTAEMLNFDIDREVIADLCLNDAETVQALKDLDIDHFDLGKLADILDPDHSGTIGSAELVFGLQRLRGDPRRSDIVTVDLMLRTVQDKLDDVLHVVKTNYSLERSSLDTVRKADSTLSQVLQFASQGSLSKVDLLQL